MKGLVIYLFFLHLVFIGVTPLLLGNLQLARLATLVYLLLLFRAGFTRGGIAASLQAGVISQLPGSISSLVILGSLTGSKLIPDVFDFIVQVWQTPFAPYLPLLPRGWWGELPPYFWFTLSLSFLLPLVPAAGAYISRRVRN